MKNSYAVIDIGSNTVVLAIYTVEGGRLHLTESFSRAVRLVGYVENDRMNPQGIHTAYETVYEFMEMLSLRCVENVYADITACGRNIKNADELIQAVQKAGCTNVRILTGEEEAMCDFYGALSDCALSEGILIDIGGGSTEFVSFHDRKADDACSIPMGCVRLSRLKRTPETSSPYIEEMRKKHPGLKNAGHAVGVGGTIRYTTYVLQELEPVECSFTRQQFERLYRRLMDEDPEAVHAVQKRVDPERAAVLLPGMGMLMAAMESFGIDIVHKSECGVREGYLAHFILHLI